MPNVAHLLKGSSIDKEKLFKAGPQTITIQTAETALFDDGEKVILSFDETDKTLSLNKTLLGFMISNHGENSDNWPGVQVTIHGQQITSGKYAGSYTAFFTQPMQQNQQPQQAPPQQARQVTPPDDEIPF